jgi:DNA-directed RNA polymerase alpha subunit
MNLERLQTCVDLLATQMTESASTLRRLSQILSDMQAKEDVPDTLVSIGCPRGVTLPLERCGVTTVGQVICRTTEELLQVRNFGETKVNKLKECLAAKGWSLKE